MDELIAFLMAIYKLSPECLQYLEKVVKVRKVKKWEFLLKEGQTSRHMYFITKGLIRALVFKDGKEISSWFLKENDVIVSIQSFYDEKVSFEYIQALEDTEVYYISKADLDFIYDHYLEFNYVGRVLTTHYLIIWDQHKFSLIMDSAQQRYEWLLANHPELIKRVPAKYIASWLGLTEVTFSKMKNKITPSKT
jgi:CRP-like cAMP-binding protein